MMRMYMIILTSILIAYSTLLFSQVEIARPIESLNRADRLDRIDMEHISLASDVEGKVHFKTLRGYYLSAFDGGMGPIHAEASTPGDFETFSIEDVNEGSLSSGDQVKLKTFKGNLVFASDNGDVSSIYFITPGIEIFTIHKVIGSGTISFGDVVCLRSSGNKYLTAVRGGGGEVNALSVRPHFTEAFFLTAASEEMTGEEQGYVKRTIEEDGTVVFEYPDGTIKKRYQGGFIIIHPDGREEIYSFMSGQPPTLPPAPDNTEQAWLEYHAESLLNFIKSLVGQDEESINLYLSTEEEMTSIYEKIQQRTVIINQLLLP
jgi:hypothetical protein